MHHLKRINEHQTGFTYTLLEIQSQALAYASASKAGPSTRLELYSEPLLRIMQRSGLWLCQVSLTGCEHALVVQSN